MTKRTFVGIGCQISVAEICNGLVDLADGLDRVVHHGIIEVDIQTIVTGDLLNKCLLDVIKMTGLANRYWLDQAWCLRPHAR